MCELEVGRIGGQETGGSRVGARQADLRVDVEDTGLAARGPDYRCAVGFVMLEVVLGDGSLKGVGRAGLIGLAGEVVCRLQGTLDALLDRSVAAVVGGENRVLKTTRVVKGNVELAVLALLRHSDTWAYGRDVLVEDESYRVSVAQDGGAHSALGASGTSVADALDFDRSRWGAIVSFKRRESWSSSSQGKESKKPLHIVESKSLEFEILGLWSRRR